MHCLRIVFVLFKCWFLYQQRAAEHCSGLWYCFYDLIKSWWPTAEAGEERRDFWGLALNFIFSNKFFEPWHGHLNSHQTKQTNKKKTQNKQTNKKTKPTLHEEVVLYQGHKQDGTKLLLTFFLSINPISVQMSPL